MRIERAAKYEKIKEQWIGGWMKWWNIQRLEMTEYPKTRDAVLYEKKKASKNGIAINKK